MRPTHEQDLFDLSRLPVTDIATKNTENLIGSVSIPVGMTIIRFIINDTEYERIVPLATYEGALVASINRGAKAISESNGARVMVEKRGVTRAPVFSCQNQAEAKKLALWLEKTPEVLEAVTRTTSAHTHYLSHHSWIRGKDLYVRFVFDTDEAMGMNMATIATDALARKIMEHFPNVSLAALSSNVCTDKKDSQINKVLGRGHWVQAEVMLPSAVVSDVLKTTPRQMERVHIQKNLVGTNIAGSFSQNAQVANVVAAIYVATGQDFAHIVEGSSADLSCENTTAGLYVALTLPSILVGVVGGGTYLPAQAQARQLIGNGQEITSEFLAAVVGATSLAGEISLLAALAQGVLAQSHQRLGRGKK